ncbi:LOW QUALITY PROTEIN: hypothetical protein PanWU01x14_026670 [Parasponia andersonii]|uniref:Uncharacterized protein n=1 Tax=Parasponia andersonii TaxID=3476 RepID=A0A2P5DW39_PARAD|nr:LOW QUALITY PROTEIN: hypothetical protein PanWU01x14_026670 [Parasponia andersonii]
MVDSSLLINLKRNAIERIDFTLIREYMAKFEARSLMEIICVAMTRTKFATIFEFDSLENDGIKSVTGPQTRKLKESKVGDLGI